MKKHPKPPQNFFPAKRTKGTAKKIRQSKGWTPERRLAQAARLRAAAIWTRSTGPRTEAGKKRSSRNAFKDDPARRFKADVACFLRGQKVFLKAMILHTRMRVPRLTSKATFSADLAVKKRLEKQGFFLGLQGQKLIVSGIKILRENNG